MNSIHPDAFIPYLFWRRRAKFTRMEKAGESPKNSSRYAKRMRDSPPTS